jgi:tRNA (guanine-N7-)-methyltransferase
MARVRVHQHVNPLAKYYRELPANPLKIEKLFENPELPLFLDIGSGRGRFLLEMAETEPDINYLGLEIREPLVIEANEIAEERKLKNLHYEFCNATVALGEILSEVPDNILQNVTIQFPDPWFKKRHAKRRMVRDKLVGAIVKHLKRSGRILIQTDVEFLGGEMFGLFRNNESLREIKIEENPLSVKTEREISVENRNLPIYRTIFHNVL